MISMPTPRVVALCSILALSACCAAQIFSDVTTGLGMDVQFSSQSIMGGGCAWFDYNDDGHEDLYITGGQNEDALFRNNGDGTFTNQIFEAGFIQTAEKNTLGVTTGDIDNDGFREVFITTQNIGLGFNHVENFLFYNNGDGTFSDITESAGLTETKWAFSGSFLDVNNDGLLDLFVGNYVEGFEVIFDDFNNPIGFDHQCYLDDLYVNQGDLTFINSTEAYQALNDGCTLAVAASDFDRDGKIDLMATNDFGEWVEPSKLLQNQGDLFLDVSMESGCDIQIYGMGLAIGDYDEDLDLDYYVTNLGPNVLLEQISSGDFEDTSESAGVSNALSGDGLAVGWGTFFFDYDNDTFLDLFVANGYISSVPWLGNEAAQNNVLFKGSNTGEFINATGDMPENLHRSRGCAFADFDKDGALDFGVMSVQQEFEISADHFTLYHNQSSAGNFVAFDLEGLICNRDAFGTHVEVHADGRSFLREIGGGSSHCSQNSSILHFGLGDIEELDSVVVHWPIGPAEVFDTLQINMFHEILQDTTIYIASPDTVLTFIKGLFSNNRLEIFPIPATDYLNFLLTGIEGIVSIEMIDLHGRLAWSVYQGDASAMPKKLAVPPYLSKGLYLCVLTTDEGKKIAVEKVEISTN